MATNLWTASLRRLLANLGVGGSSWTRTRPSGDGRSAARTTATATITGYVVRGKLDALQGGAPPTVALATAPWWWYSATDQDVLPGDELASASDSTIVFTVPGELVTENGYMNGEVRPA